MALSENDDVVSRGRAIFDRLRDEGSTDPPLPEETQETSPALDEEETLSETEHVPADVVDEIDPLPEDSPADSAPTAASDSAAADPATAEPIAAPADSPLDAAAPGSAPTPGDPATGPATAAPDLDSALAPNPATPAPAPASATAAPDPDPAPATPLDDDPGSATPGGNPVPAPAEPPAPAPAALAPDSPGPEPDVPEAVAAVVADAAAVLTSSDEAPAPVVSPLVRPLPRIMAIANQKGGVGKTTTAVNLGAALAELGYRVLVVDLDPQGNATTGLGINPRTLETSVYDVIMHDTPLEDAIEPTSLRNLFVVPATIDLAGAEIELVPAFSRELKLRRALETVQDDFDYTLIDCPPSLGLITVNGLAAATEVVVPIQCEYYALEGLGQLLRNVSLVQGNLNPKLEVSAIILTMFDARTKLAEQVAGEVRAHFGEKVCRNIVPRTVRLSEAPSFGQPIIVFDPTSRGAIAYRELAKEVSGGAPQRIG